MGISLTDTPPSVGQGPLVPPVVPEPTRRAGPSGRVLLAAAVTTLMAVAALFLLGRGDSGAQDDRPGRGDPSHYTVRPGDTLTSVATLHGIPVDDLLAALDLTLEDSVDPGDVLEIPELPSDGSEWPHRLVADPLRAQQNAYFERWAAEYDVPTSLLQALA